MLNKNWFFLNNSFLLNKFYFYSMELFIENLKKYFFCFFINKKRIFALLKQIFFLFILNNLIFIYYLKPG
ncbi:MAG: hypothetical protein Q8885_00175 [Candidatus Phytoplasma stylosanthis]|nr:hypothetical protein [Candidatus Phytoplasma stylosanthis]